MSQRLLVLDASAAVHLATMADRWDGLATYRLHAPPLMWSEALSALCQAAYRREMPPSALEAAINQLESLPVATSDADRAHRRASLAIALDLGWAKTYDAEYIALARSLGCALLTMDKRLQRGAERIVDLVEPMDLV